MHHWEHKNRQGSGGHTPPPKDARLFPGHVVVCDAGRLLVNVRGRSCPNYFYCVVKCDALGHAMELYDRQYGDEEGYDPGQRDAYEGMRGEWRGGALRRRLVYDTRGW